MASINCVEMTINKDNTQKGLFILEPLEVGQGITVGNSLRRVLLSDLTGYAINGVRINNLKHEFTIIEGIREDTLEVLLKVVLIFTIPVLLIFFCNFNIFKN